MPPRNAEPGHAFRQDAVAHCAHQFFIGMLLNLAGRDVRAALTPVPIEPVARGAGCRESFTGFGESSGVRRVWLRRRWRGLAQNRGRVNDQCHGAKHRRQQWNAKARNKRPDYPASSAIHSAIIAQKPAFKSPQNSS